MWVLRVCISGKFPGETHDGSRRIQTIPSIPTVPTVTLFCRLPGSLSSALPNSHSSCPVPGSHPNLSKPYSFFKLKSNKLHIRIAWGVLKNCEVPGYTPDQLIQNFWRLNSVVIVFKAVPMISIGSQGENCPRASTEQQSIHLRGADSPGHLT